MYSISKQFKDKRSTTCKYSAIFFVKGISEFVTTQLRDRNIYKSQGESREIFFQEGKPEKYNWKTHCWRSHCIHLPAGFLGEKRIFCIYYWKKLPNWILREDLLSSKCSFISKQEQNHCCIFQFKMDALVYKALYMTGKSFVFSE